LPGHKENPNSRRKEAASGAGDRESPGTDVGAALRDSSGAEKVSRRRRGARQVPDGHPRQGFAEHRRAAKTRGAKRSGIAMENPNSRTKEATISKEGDQ